MTVEVTFTLISHENGDSDQYKLINDCKCNPVFITEAH